MKHKDAEDLQSEKEKNVLQHILDTEVYTSLDEAVMLLSQRWKDTVLRSFIADTVGGDIPAPFLEHPYGVLFRNVATPNHECQQAIQKANSVGLNFLYLEYLKDRFCTINPDKRVLGRMVFTHTKNKHGEYIYSKKNIFDLASYDGKRFCDIDTIAHGPLVDFHHRMFQENCPGVQRYDLSAFAQKSGRNSQESYPFYLSLFTCMGILFEDYDMSSAEERRFVKETIIPAMRTVTELYGMKPLIVRLYDGDESVDYWNAYPLSIKSQYGI